MDSQRGDLATPEADDESAEADLTADLAPHSWRVSQRGQAYPPPR